MVTQTKAKVWRSGRKCGRTSRLTRDDNTRDRCLNPGVRAEVGEIIGLWILSQSPIVKRDFGHHFAGAPDETFVEVPAILVRSCSFIGV